MSNQHHYALTIQWTGNTGTSGYRAYERSHALIIPGKPAIACSSDTPFHGDASCHNPEDMLLAALSSCHMLWYLYLCADAGIVVTAYEDHATGTLTATAPGGQFTAVTLHPKVTVAETSMIVSANELHEAANKHCFMANSVNFPVHQEPACRVQD